MNKELELIPILWDKISHSMVDHTAHQFSPRVAEHHLNAVLEAQPVAVVMGARQTGKSTLVRHAGRLARHTYLTLDALDTRAQAASDPEGLVARHDLIILDEIQRVPDLVIAIKRAIDESLRRPGRFVIT